MRSYDYQPLDFDITLIELFHPVEVTAAVAPIPMGELPCCVSGWGNAVPEGDSSGDAHPPAASGLSRRWSERLWQPSGVCVGGVHGLMSRGQRCAQPNYPGVYVKVCEFVYWIADPLALNP
ncbi:trypsin-like [Salarias fasciatus]|uniref:trypsin-like n=1 Tax=Salarias fasciatus TaxID=181472 RepID=UPI00117698FB|nr:trypsin-like [Salarias fasciatus]